jgi:predicted acetyltransferase
LRKEGGHIGYGVRPSARRRGHGTELLRSTLLKAKELGLRKVLVTCGKENLGSVKVILVNGGVLESEEFMQPRNEVVQRYWIDLEVGYQRAL